MDRREVAAVLAYIGRLDPRTVRTGTGEARDQIAQWQELLDDVPFATDHGWDVRKAIRSHVLDSPYPILPVDIARRWRAHRRDRLDRHTDPTPAADPDDPAAWRAELLRSRNAVAAGIAAPSTHHQITTGGRPRDVEERLSEIGSCIPPPSAPSWPATARRAPRARPPSPRASPMRSVSGATGATHPWAPPAANAGRPQTEPPGAMPYERFPTPRASTSPLPGGTDTELRDAALIRSSWQLPWLRPSVPNLSYTVPMSTSGTASRGPCRRLPGTGPL